MGRVWDAAEFAPVLAQLEASQARYVVVGSVAASIHGLVRKVGDLDVAVDAEVENERVVMRALTLRGFFPTIPLGLSEVVVLRTFDADGREVDLKPRQVVPFSELWAESVIRSLGGVAVRVACLEHLVRLKRQSGRPEDLVDAGVLLDLHRRGVKRP